MTTIEKVKRALKNRWVSNFRLIVELKTSSADRELRRLRETEPIQERWKKETINGVVVRYKQYRIGA